MNATLRERLAASTTLVVGKGGVGKSTTAAALALAWADDGAATHLISTDPAHSLGDILAQSSGAEPQLSRCSPLLVIEEFDAAAHARRWLRDAAAPLTELLERGTYLDTEDVRSLSALALPGVDEVMAALRLAELRSRHRGRLVVDTAPTGHTLRLLSAGRLLDGWISAFRAMAGKAGAVAEALARRRVRFAAEAVLDELEARVRSFTDEVVRHADVVVVSRAEPVVEAETERLLARLAELEARVTRLWIGGGGGAQGFQVPLLPDARGCAGLRNWAAAVTPAARNAPDSALPAAGPGPSAGSGAADAVLPLLRRELVFFAGKGGVGKSTCAAAAALALAQERRVVLISTDPAGSLAEVLELEIGRHPVAVTPRLTARQVDAAAEFEAFRGEFREEIRDVFTALGLDESAALDQRVLESLWDLAPPGLDEIFALSALIADAPADGTLIVDSAPTGHFLRLLEMPEIATQWTQALMRVLLKYGTALRLDDTTEHVLRFAKQLKELKLKLSDPARAGTFVVTLAEPVVASETRRLGRALAAAGFPRAALLLNRSGSAAPPAHPPAELTGADGPLIIAPSEPAAPRGMDRLCAFFSNWRLVQ
jgi:arsenite/tail-anchored protein-transporting ATPase